MSEVLASPTHFRLLAALKAIGPYLRESESQEGCYLFDCLSVCIDDKKSPEEREFWGWWMELESNDSGFTANFQAGMYDFGGNWVKTEIPEKAKQEVTRTKNDFMDKLSGLLKERFSQGISLHKESEVFV